MKIELTVLGEPKSQKRHRSTKVGGFIRQYDPSSADKGDFLSIVQSQAPQQPFTTPVSLFITFYFTRPKSHFRTGTNSHVLKPTAPLYHTGKPDIDNCIKFIMDALNKVYWKDDGQVYSCRVLKYYDDKPRTELTIMAHESEGY